MNDEYKKSCKEAVVAYMKTLSHSPPGGTVATYEHSESVWLVFEPSFEAGSFKIRNRSLIYRCVWYRKESERTTDNRKWRFVSPAYLFRTKSTVTYWNC
jgi:hypothetical protein